MKNWILGNPAKNGAILGSLVLGFIRVPPAALYLHFNASSPGLFLDTQPVFSLGFVWAFGEFYSTQPGVLMDFFSLLASVSAWVFGGFYWGSILGRGGGRAYAAWCEGDSKFARRLCLDYGYWGAGISFVWMLAVSFFGSVLDVAFGGTSGTRIGARILVEYCVINTNFQAYILLVMAGLLLSRGAGHSVQVTEKVRL